MDAVQPGAKTAPIKSHLGIPTQPVLGFSTRYSQTCFSKSFARCLKTNLIPGDPAQESNQALSSKPLGFKEFSGPISLVLLAEIENGQCRSFHLWSRRVPVLPSGILGRLQCNIGPDLQG